MIRDRFLSIGERHYSLGKGVGLNPLGVRLELELSLYIYSFLMYRHRNVAGCACAGLVCIQIFPSSAC